MPKAKKAGIGTIKLLEKKVGIGTIKLFDPANKRGVIAPQKAGSTQSQQTDDLYFEVGDAEALRLRVGQLVQFVFEDTDVGAEAKDVTVLSESA